MAPLRCRKSVDGELEEIRRTLSTVRRTLYKWWRAAENVPDGGGRRVHSPLDQFDLAVRGVREDVGRIRDSVIQITEKIPSQYALLAIFLLAYLIICAVALLLILKIVEGLREIGQWRRKGRDGGERGDGKVIGRRRRGGTGRTPAEAELVSPLLAPRQITPSPRGILRAPSQFPKLGGTQFAVAKRGQTTPLTAQLSLDGDRNQKE